MRFVEVAAQEAGARTEEMAVQPQSGEGRELREAETINNFGMLNAFRQESGFSVWSQQGKKKH